MRGRSLAGVVLGRGKEQSQSAKFATVRPIEELSWRKLNGPFDSMYTREKDGLSKIWSESKIKEWGTGREQNKLNLVREKKRGF